MDFTLSDEDRQLRDTVREFVEEVANPVCQQSSSTPA